MIIFDLACDCGFQFEGWFQDHDDFYSQKKEGLISCPKCGEDTVRKILSPVAVRSAPLKQLPPQGKKNQLQEKQLFDKTLKALQEFVEKTFEDVGTNFTQEALKIHYGVDEARNIRGVTTPEEETLLEKEGIELLKIPMPAKNDKIH